VRSGAPAARGASDVLVRELGQEHALHEAFGLERFRRCAETRRGARPERVDDVATAREPVVEMEGVRAGAIERRVSALENERAGEAPRSSCGRRLGHNHRVRPAHPRLCSRARLMLFTVGGELCRRL